MKTLINIKTDKEVKIKAQKLAEEFGLTLSAVTNALLKEFVRNQSITLTKTPTPTPYLNNILEQAHKDYEENKNISPKFTSPEEAIKWLHKK